MAPRPLFVADACRLRLNCRIEGGSAASRGDACGVSDDAFRPHRRPARGATGEAHDIDAEVPSRSCGTRRDGRSAWWRPGDLGARRSAAWCGDDRSTRRRGPRPGGRLRIGCCMTGWRRCSAASTKLARWPPNTAATWQRCSRVAATALLSHHSAAAIWKIRPKHDGDVHVTVSGHDQRSRPGLRVHRSLSLNAAVHDGLPLTTLARTLLDLATLPPPAPTGPRRRGGAGTETHHPRRATPTARQPRPRARPAHRTNPHPLRGRAPAARPRPSGPPPAPRDERACRRPRGGLPLARSQARRRGRRVRVPRARGRRSSATARGMPTSKRPATASSGSPGGRSSTSRTPSSRGWRGSCHHGRRDGHARVLRGGLLADR